MKKQNERMIEKWIVLRLALYNIRSIPEPGNIRVCFLKEVHDHTPKRFDRISKPFQIERLHFRYSPK
jgi:hypothetical protein